MRESEAAKALSEKSGLFKSPELFEKYVIAIEVTFEVLSHIFGTEPGSSGTGSDDVKGLLESFGCSSVSGRRGAAGKLDEVAAELLVKHRDLELQVCAMQQQQLQMHDEVSQLSASLNDAMSQVSAVSEDVARLKQDVSNRASNGAVKELSEMVSDLNDSESSLKERLLRAEERVGEAELVLRDKIRGEIESLKAAMKLVPTDPLNGIIAQLTRECGGNIHQKGVVEVTASGNWGDDQSKVEHVVELGTNSRLATTMVSDSWIRYDFKDRRVAPTSYSIRSHDVAYPRSWVLEVSSDGNDGSWQIVDRRDNNFDLNVSHVTRNFAISNRPSGSFRFIRLRQTGPNHRGDGVLESTSLEIFGTLS